MYQGNPIHEITRSEVVVFVWVRGSFFSSEKRTRPKSVTASRCFLAEPFAERRALLIVHANFGEFVNAANLGK